jgi:hypothetical protein
VFNSIIKKYGTPNPLPNQAPGAPPAAPAEPGEGVNTGNPPPAPGATNAPQSPAELPQPQGAPLAEGKNINSFEEMVNELLGIKNVKDQQPDDEPDSLLGRAKSLNAGAKKMINEIDKMITEGSVNFNTNPSDKNFTYNENKTEEKKEKKK